MDIKTICVVGGGRMGRQIALCASIAGVDATVYDLMPAVLEDVAKWEEEYLAGRIAKGRMTEQQVVGLALGKMHELGAERESYPLWVLTGKGSNQAISRPRNKAIAF